MASPTTSASAAYKKTAGTLTLDGAVLRWSPSAPAAPGVKQASAFSEALSKVLALFASRPETGKHNLKLTFYPSSPLTGDKGITFNFTDPATAQEDAARLKNILATIASQNRLDKAGPPGVEPVDVKPVIRPPPPAGTAASAAGPNQPPAAVASSSSSSSAAAAAPSSSKPVVAAAQPSAAAAAKGKGRNLKEDWELHKRVLVKNPQLAALHYELVQSGQITDEEFWEGRELLLTSESLSSHQRPGRSSQLIDDRWTSSSKSSATTSGTGQGTTKAAQKGNAMGTISLTPELIRDIFDEFPDVHLAWKQNVPKVVTEPVFWQRYFNSRLWERHRASARTSGGKGTAKEDEMFDKYLGEVDDGIEPQNQSSEVVNRFLDLAATEVDHEDTGNAKDITMQAGKQRASLPLMRRFNEHSEKLLKASDSASARLAESSTPHAGADERVAKRPRLDEPGSSRDESRFAEIDLPELNTASAPTAIGLDLDMGDRRGLFEGGGVGSSGEVGNGPGETSNGKRPRTANEVAEIAAEVKDGFRGWRAVLNATRLEKRSAEEVMAALTASVRSRLDAKSNKDAIPPATLHQLTTLHTSTTEFLRQFYASILPPAPASSLPSVSAAGSTSYHLGARLTDAQRKEKVDKMVGRLRKVRAKADELVGSCAGEERERVRAALSTTLASVDKALAFHQSRRK